PVPLLPLLCLAQLPAGTAYGFRSCHHPPRDPNLFLCVGHRLGTVPAAVGDLPPAATSLNLSHNSIALVPTSSFAHLPRLCQLDLAHNRLAQLEPGAFQGLAQLAALNLSHNHLARLEPGTFTGLAQLQTLDLAANRLAQLAEGTFAGLGNLTELRLDHNPLLALAPRALQALPSLARLFLRGCQLRALGEVAEAVQSLARLRLLDLCGNNLAQPPRLAPPRLAPPRRLAPLPTSLQELLLCNNSLQGLAWGTAGLPPALGTLDLAFNNISSPQPFAHLHLGTLKHLRLEGNPLDPLLLLAHSDLPPGSLDLSGLPLGTAGLAALCQRLAGRGQLARLQLRRLALSELSPGTLASCPPAATLDLSGNPLRRLGCLGKLLRPPQRLALLQLVAEGSALRRLAPCPPGAPLMPNLRQLSLRFHRLLLLPAEAFAHAPGLRRLRLELGSLARLHPRALRGLRALSGLSLDGNLLNLLLPGTFAPLRALRCLGLRNNRLGTLLPGTFAGLASLRRLDLGGNRLRHLGTEALMGLGALRQLYLDGNRLRALPPELFAPLRASLRLLDLSANFLRALPASSFRQLCQLRSLALRGQRPWGLKVVPADFFRGLAQLRWLHLGQNNLRVVPADVFAPLAQLRGLALPDVGRELEELPEGIFANLSQLRSLDLAGTGVRVLGTATLAGLGQLRWLRLAHSRLALLEPGTPRLLPALRYLDLRGCPLSCACANAWLPTWLLRGAPQVPYLYNYTCGQAGTGSLAPPTYLLAFDASVCYGGEALPCFALTMPTALALLVVPFLCHRWRWWRGWAPRRGWRWKRGQRRLAFDVFISYSDANQRWVLGTLVPELEGSALRLCLPPRDFRPGCAILDNISWGVLGSARTLCVLSPAYLSNARCQLELRLAASRRLAELCPPLLVMLLLAPPRPGAQLAAWRRLRRDWLLQGPLLSWPRDPRARPLFWARLKGALRGHGEEEEGDG
ncbi:TLR13 protein, partial [Eubucco bourcierii]|nr:TLR13 protein [Eubucco bourcierii]